VITFLKRLTEACFSPVGLMTLSFAAGLLIRVTHRSSRLGRRLLWSGACLYLISLFTPLAEVVVANLERPYPPMMHPDVSSGIRSIVILSAYGEDHSFLSATSRLYGESIARMVEGIRLYRELPGARLVVSGGILRAEDRPIASQMADFARALGVPDRDIVVEGRSETTYENLVEVKKIIGTETFILVTSASDLRRAMAVARKLGMKPLAAPTAFWAAQRYPAGMSRLEWSWRLLEDFTKPSINRLGYLQRAYHEHVGYIWYWMLGRL
jgi:uncharacterized SAM-binding protein YcdF (DUF218 family)